MRKKTRKVRLGKIQISCRKTIEEISLLCPPGVESLATPLQGAASGYLRTPSSVGIAL